MPEQSEPLPLEDIADPLQMLPQQGIPPWLIILALIALAVAIYCVRKYLLQPKTAQDRAAERAFAEAKAAIAETRKADLTPSETATQLSFALREYLATATREPALFQTHEEFLLSDSALGSLPHGSRQPTSDFFSQLAELKYGNPVEHDDSQEKTCSAAETLLLSLHSTQAQLIE